MRHEPAIVKELREEEKKGGLYLRNKKETQTSSAQIIKQVPHNNPLQQNYARSCFQGSVSSVLPQQGPSTINELIFQKTNDLIIFIDYDGRILRANQITLKLLGVTEEQILGKELWEMFSCFSKKPLTNFQQLTETILSGHHLQNQLVVFYDVTGKIQTVGFSSYEVDQQTSLLVGRVDPDLKKTKELFHNFLKNASEGIILCDTSGNILEINQVMETYGFDKQDVFGRNIKEYIPKKYWNQITNDIQCLISGKPVSGEIELIINDKSIYFEYRSSSFIENQEIAGILFFIHDISERKIAQQKLQESEQKYRNIILHSNEMFYIHDTHNRFTYVSPQSKMIMGYSPEEMMVNWKKLLTNNPINKIGITLTMKAIKTGKRQKPYILEVKKKDGTKGFVEIDESPILDSNGNVIGIIGATRDITEKKHIDDALKKNEQMYRTIIETTSACVASIDIRGRLDFVNKTFLELLGYSHEEMLGKPFTKFLHPADKKRIWKEYLNSFIHPNDKLEIEFRLIHKDGHILHMFAAPKIVRHNGKIIGFNAVIQDYTERLRTKERYQNLFENATEGIIIIDLQGNVLEINKFFNTFGLKYREYLGKNIMKVISKKETQKIMKELQKISSGKECNGELEISTKKGNYVLEYQANSIIEDGRITGAIVFARDITERKRNEQELKIAHTQLEKINIDLENKVKERTAEVEYLLKQKDEFIAQLGHDLKNPLTPLVTLLPLIKNQSSDQKYQEIISIVINNATYMKNLVMKTLELARLNSPNTSFEYQELRLYDIVENVVKTQQTMLQQHHIHIKNNLPKELRLEADKLRLDEVFTNLISNAIKFTPDNGKIAFTAKTDKNMVTISIKDNGIGMNKTQISNIFTEFYKVDSSRHDLESTGLGLSICKRIIEKHGGKIWVESKGHGKGTTFHFTLPQKQQ